MITLYWGGNPKILICRVIANSTHRNVFEHTESVFVGCGRITANPEVAHFGVRECLPTTQPEALKTGAGSPGRATQHVCASKGMTPENSRKLDASSQTAYVTSRTILCPLRTELALAAFTQPEELW